MYHVSIQCANVAASAAFYDAVLAPLGGGRVREFGQVIGFGVARKPDFWIGPQSTGEGFRESHIAFAALDRAAVRAFYEAAVSTGPDVLHEPRLWPEVPPQLLRRIRPRSRWQQRRGRLPQRRIGLRRRRTSRRSEPAWIP